MYLWFLLNRQKRYGGLIPPQNKPCQYSHDDARHEQCVEAETNDRSPIGEVNEVVLVADGEQYHTDHHRDRREKLDPRHIMNSLLQ